MSYCHNRGIVHRDLKLENVLLKSRGDNLIKVVDFGIAGVCTTNKKDKVDAGSIAYMPPEVTLFVTKVCIVFQMLARNFSSHRCVGNRNYVLLNVVWNSSLQWRN